MNEEAEEIKLPIAFEDYVEPLMQARRLLKDVDFGLLVNDRKYETALCNLRLARAYIKSAEVALGIYQQQREVIEFSELVKTLKEKGTENA